MNLSTAIIKRINFYLTKNNMTIWKLYKASGIPKSTLFALMSNSTTIPKLETLQYISEGLGITLREFFNDKIFDEIKND